MTSPSKKSKEEEKTEALSRALKLIDQLELLVEDDVKKEKDIHQSQLNEIDDKFNAFNEEDSFFAIKSGKTISDRKDTKEIKKEERLSLSHSIIEGNDSFRPSQGGGFYDTGFDKDDFDFKNAMDEANRNISDEEVGLLSEQIEPKRRLEP